MSRNRQTYIIHVETPAHLGHATVQRRVVVEHKSARLAREFVRRALPLAPIGRTFKVERRFRPALRALLDEIEQHYAASRERKREVLAARKRPARSPSGAGEAR